VHLQTGLGQVEHLTGLDIDHIGFAEPVATPATGTRKLSIDCVRCSDHLERVAAVTLLTAARAGHPRNRRFLTIAVAGGRFMGSLAGLG
jgi:hypothetical protein